jgi:hypothetical protein
MAHDYSTFQLPDCDKHVFVPSAAAKRSVGRDGFIASLHRPHGEIDVMSGEIFNDTNIGDTSREWPLPARRYLKHLTKQALGDLLSHRLDCRVKPFDMANSADELSGGESINEPSCLICGDRYGFFDEGMNSAFSQLQTEFKVVCGRCCEYAIVKTTLHKRVK